MSVRRARRTRVVLELANRQRDADRSLVVIKLGGSLLESPKLVERIEWLLAQRPEARCLFVCGGGPAANIVRQWQQAHGFSDEQAHWLALQAITFNEALLLTILPDSTLVVDEEQIASAWEQDERAVLACERFVRDYESASAEPLPHNWDVTSDSIALWCARQIEADELILAKSTDLEPGMSAIDAAGRGFVDSHFPHLIEGISISWTNLRAEVPTLTDWL